MGCQIASGSGGICPGCRPLGSPSGESIRVSTITLIQNFERGSSTFNNEGDIPDDRGGLHAPERAHPISTESILCSGHSWSGTIHDALTVIDPEAEDTWRRQLHTGREGRKDAQQLTMARECWSHDTG